MKHTISFGVNAVLAQPSIPFHSYISKNKWDGLRGREIKQGIYYGRRCSIEKKTEIKPLVVASSEISEVNNVHNKRLLGFT